MKGVERGYPAVSSRRERSDVGSEVVRELYVLIVAGVTTGALVVGLGSRLAMFVLRVTSSSDVVGVQSDDGFTIGRFTLGGTYNLLVIGAVVGVAGAGVVQWVRPWLLGPRWFRLVTLGLASGAVVGSLLVHADGIDFTLLEPMWLAVSLFIALPAAFAVCVALAVERVERHVTAGTTLTWRSWIAPVALVVLFPPVVVVLAIAAVILIVWVAVRDRSAVRSTADSTVVGVLVRGAWLGIAVVGLVALLGDVADLRAIDDGAQGGISAAWLGEQMDGSI